MKTFNDLHEDVILDIFDYLSCDGLKTAMEVCKKWNNIIGQNIPMKSKFKLVLNKDWENNSDDIQKMSRLVPTVKIQLMELKNSEICDVLKKFNMQVRVVLILKDVIICSEIFTNLVMMLQLDKLILNDARVSLVQSGTTNDMESQNKLLKNFNDASEEKVVKLPKLLALFNPNSMLLDMLTQMNFRPIVIHYKITENDYIFRRDAENDFDLSLRNFMKNQMGLKKFVIDSPASKAVFGPVIEQLKSAKLENLVTLLQASVDIPNKNNTDNLADFIKSQPAIKTLKISTESISQDAVKAIYQAKNLHLLHLNILDLPKTLELPVPCTPHANLKKFAISRVTSEQSLDAMFQMFPAIDTLAVNESNDSVINSGGIAINAQNRLKSLKYLSIPNMLNFPQLTISSLRRLHLFGVSSVEEVRMFLSQNPLIVELDINRILDQTFNHAMLVELVRGSINLKKLCIGSTVRNFEVNESLLRSLKESCPCLSIIVVSTKIACVGLPDRFSVDKNIRDFSSIRVVKLDSDLDNSVFSRIHKLFEDGDADLECIKWLDEEEDGNWNEPYENLENGLDYSSSLDDFNYHDDYPDYYDYVDYM